MITLDAWLNRHAHEKGSQQAIHFGDREISYEALEQDVRRLAHGLQKLGIAKGDVVAVQLPNIPEFIISYLAITSLGAVVQTLHMPYRKAELEYLLRDSQAKAAICLSEFKDYSPAKIINEIAQSLQQSYSVIALGEEVENTNSFNTLLREQVLNKQTQLTESDRFIILYTSGTTSEPKGVPHNYGAFLSNAQNCAHDYGFTDQDKLLSVAPMTHLYGLFVCNMTLSIGASSLLLPTFSPPGFVDLVKKQRPSAIFAAPAHFAACFQNELAHKEDFESVKFVCLSGSTVLPELARQVDALLVNGKVGQLWGMSELQAGAITRLEDSETVRFNSAGRATKETELRVVDSEQQILGPNEEGELQIKGGALFDGYLNKAEETKKAFTSEGWFCSGDLAVLDEEGNLRITGRVKHVINRGGVKYNPVEVEEIVAGIEGINSCAVVPLPDPVLGEKACLFVVTKSGVTISLDDINNVLFERGIAKYKWPERLEFVESMPLTPTNKIKHEELKKLI